MSHALRTRLKDSARRFDSNLPNGTRQAGCLLTVVASELLERVFVLNKASAGIFSCLYRTRKPREALVNDVMSRAADTEVIA